MFQKLLDGMVAKSRGEKAFPDVDAIYYITGYHQAIMDVTNQMLKLKKYIKVKNISFPHNYYKATLHLERGMRYCESDKGREDYDKDLLKTELIKFISELGEAEEKREEEELLR